ncbi:thioredoxin family protein [Wenzhouxiangella sp. XN24]|uniref:thioredoxin family protein n=1 Tax=Wenzhouxiangella sp. XN24 TaxID=2713569 RepID=UPI0013EBFFBF|nr:thioredoxin family protein [Wenzhouxiangella sp. XN24]NGX15629.1 thioredoxin family protein [Wenzhouxiangella sp. XN24]
MKKPALWTVTVLLFAVALYFGVGAISQEAERFTPQRFAALQAQDALVLVEIHATWCVTCRRQREIVRRYREAHPGVDLVLLSIDFDTQKSAVEALGARYQSTLALYRGRERRWYAVGETREEVIFAALNQAAGSADGR